MNYFRKENMMFNRFYNDYLMPSRLTNYETLLKKFLKNDFKFICVKDYHKLFNDNFKYCIIRHDIDSDVNIAKKMFEIEKKLNIYSTYYFRKSTLNKEFIKEINEYGSEVGYHYEEIASFCRKEKNINRFNVKNNIFLIKQSFIENIEQIEKEYNIKIYSIASHGDFINRKIDIANKYLYDNDMQNKLKLIEAYDVEQYLDFRTKDAMYPKLLVDNPDDAIVNSKKVLLLIHPRWWNKAPFERFRLDIKRLWDELFIKFYKNN